MKASYQMIQGNDPQKFFNGAIWSAFDTILTSVLPICSLIIKVIIIL